jgi:hypothetical protein
VRWRLFAAAIAGAALAACGGEAEAPPVVTEATPEACADNDIECRNREWVKAFAEEDRRQPKLPLDGIFDDWVVAAALEPEGRSMGGTWVTTYAHRDVWIGAEVAVTRAAITIDAPAGAPVVREDGLGPGALYPRCTRPDFDTEEMVSASPVEDYIDLWRHFGFDKPVVGRPALVRCNGEQAFPDDGTGHVDEMTVEEAGAVEVLYLYDPDRLLMQWGDLALLLLRERG